MPKVVYEGDDFKRMLRADMANIQRLVDAGRFGKHKVSYKDKVITIEISKKMDSTIVVKRLRVN